jgi:hypothetical protein
MKCEICNQEISETVYPFHLLRCKVDEPLTQKPEGEIIPPENPESDLNQKPEEPIQPEPEIEPQPEPVKAEAEEQIIEDKPVEDKPGKSKRK